MKIPRPIAKLINSFERLPGIGPKTAQRLTFYLLHFPQEELDKFADAISELKRGTVLCSICKNVDENDPCSVCDDSSRNNRQILVVSSPLDVLAMERTGYKGVYNVLHGIINPLSNIGPEELYINEIIERLSGIFGGDEGNYSDFDALNKDIPAGNMRESQIEDFDDLGFDSLEMEFTSKSTEHYSTFQDLVEVVLATNTSMEGESTAMYISKLIRDSGYDETKVKITRIARGIPVGGDIEYADDITLTRALEGRSTF